MKTLGLIGSLLAVNVALAAGPAPQWTASFTSGTTDINSKLMSGTEGRQFAALNIGNVNAKLYLGLGNWNDSVPQNAQILVMATPNGSWQQDVQLGATSDFTCPTDDTRCILAVSA